MKTRIITAIVLILAFGAVVVFGEGELEFLFSGGVVLLATAAAYEFMIRCHRHNKTIYWYHYLPILMTLGFVLLNVILFDQTAYFKGVMIGFMSIVFVYLMLYLFDQRMHRGELGVLLVSTFYISFGFIGLAVLRHSDLFLLLYLLVITISTDTFAYFIGIKFGKHRLMPKVSPKKSIEGALGGLIFASVIGTWFAMHFDLISESLIILFFLSVSLSLVSQAGDLIASKFKREVGLKDYSHIFPGHGGILDRFDSLVFAGAYLMVILMVI